MHGPHFIPTRFQSTFPTKNENKDSIVAAVLSWLISVINESIGTPFIFIYFNFQLPQNVNSLTVMGTGTGVAMVQMTINYNIQDPDPSDDLQVNVISLEEEVDNKVKVDVCFRLVFMAKF